MDEELVRLKSHIAATRRELEAGGSVGRKLDFIAQELESGRPIPILSKSTDLAVSDRAIALKNRDLKRYVNRSRTLNRQGGARPMKHRGILTVLSGFRLR